MGYIRVIMANADRILLDSNVVKETVNNLYLTPKYFETESRFQMIKVKSLRIGPSRAGESFSLNLSEEVDVKNYQVVLIQFEAFGQFITADEL